MENMNQLAKAVGLQHSTLSRLRSGETMVTNPKTLGKLSEILRVPVTWLTGEDDQLPHVPKHGLLEVKEADDEATVGETTVALSHLLQRAEEALRRDLNRWIGEDGEAVYQAWGKGFLWAVGDLCSPVFWRDAMLEPRDSSAELLRGVLTGTAAIAWAEMLLGPWFADTAELKASVLRNVLSTLYAAPDRVTRTTATEDTHLYALDAYERIRQEHAHE